MEFQAKLNEKYTPVLHCISSFEGIPFKKLRDTATSSCIPPPSPSSVISCCFSSAFTSADIIFHNFLELHSIFPLLTDSPPPPLAPSLDRQNPLSVTDFFCR